MDFDVRGGSRDQRPPYMRVSIYIEDIDKKGLIGMYVYFMYL